MGSVKIEQTVTGAAPSVTYTGAGWTTASALAQASGGSIAFTSTNGDSVAINVPTGKSGILIIVRRSANPGVAAVSVDGGAATNYTLFNGSTTASPNYSWEQAALPPVYFTNTGVTHTVTLTQVSGTIYLDAVEFYDTSNAFVAGTLAAFGHSIMYGYNGVPYPADVSAPLTTTFVAEVARQLGMTATNQCVPGEDLSNGGQFQTLSASANLTAGTYTLGDGTHTSAATNWNATITTINANLAAGSVPWVAIGAGATTPFIGGPTPLRIAQSAAGAAATALAVTPTSITGGTLSITGNQNPQFYNNGYSPTPAWMRAATGTSAGPYNWGVASGATNAPYVQAAVDTWGARKPEIALVMHGFNDVSYSAIYDLGTGVAAGNPAGAGWAKARFKQRALELCWRMNLWSPGTVIVLCGMSYGTALGTGQLREINGALAEVAADASVFNVVYVDLFHALKAICWPVTVGLQDTAHPTNAGQLVLAAPIVAAVMQARQKKLMRVR